MKALQSYTEANLLIGVPATPLRNLISNAQSTAFRLMKDGIEGAWNSVATRSGKPLKDAIFDPLAALIDTLKPSTVRELTPEFLGTARSQAARYGSASKGLYSSTVDALMQPIKMGETLFARYHQVLSAKRLGIPIDSRAILAKSEDLYKVGKESRLWVGSHDDLPRALNWIRDHIPGATQFASYPYILGRQYLHLLGGANPLIKMPLSERFAKLMTFATATAAPAYWKIKNDTGHTFDGVPYDMDTTGRSKVGTTAEGNEVFAKDRDLPIGMLGELGAGAWDVVTGRGSRRLSALAEDQISVSPIGMAVLHTFGFNRRYDNEWRGGKLQPKSWGRKVGGDLKSLVPFGRATESVHRMMGGQKFNTTGFWDEIAKGLPIPWQGQPAMDSKGNPKLHKPSKEVLQYFAALNLMEVNPDEYNEKVQLRIEALGREFAKTDMSSDYEREMLRKKYAEVDPKLAATMFDGIDEEGDITLTPEKAEKVQNMIRPDPKPASPAKGGTTKADPDKAREIAERIKARAKK
jgi:hypothetical protein